MDVQAANRGFSLIELLITLAVLGIVIAVALPSYRDHVVRSSRAAAQTELVELAAVQEKIYLNSNAYTASVTAPYNGTDTGGLGKTSGTTADAKYALTLVRAGQSYTLTATPVAGSTQQNDGAFSIASNGVRACVEPPASWCVKGAW